MKYFAHKTADVSKKAKIGSNTHIWNQAQVREGARIGKNCTIAKNVYVDFDVRIGDNCKIENNTSIFHGVTVEDGVFIGPHVVFANDKTPRAITVDGKPKNQSDWVVGKTSVRFGASIGAHSVILPDINIGSYALVGAGSVVTKDIPDFTLVYGNPARFKGYICVCGKAIHFKNKVFTCVCGCRYELKKSQVVLKKV